MRILTVLTYYRPHTSGLTIYAERLARALAKRGHQVTVMTTHYDPALPPEEWMDGVKVLRVPVALRLSKGVIAPTFGLVATRLVWEHDVVQMHLPQFDAPGVAMRGRLFGKPAVLTYHCDLRLPPGIFNRLVNLVIQWQNNMAGILSDQVVTYTRDYADHSSYLSRYKSKLRTILPPVELPSAGRGCCGGLCEGARHRRAATGDRHGGALCGRKRAWRCCWMRCRACVQKYPDAPGAVCRTVRERDGRAGLCRPAHAAHP